MAGTGAAHDAAEISFDLPDDGESSAEVTEPTPQPEEKVAPAEAVPERTEPKSKSQSQLMVESVTPDESERTKTLDTNASTQEQRREWAIPKAIESEAAGVDQAVVTHDKQSKPKEAPMGKDVTSDPNANGDGRTESADFVIPIRSCVEFVDPRSARAITTTSYQSKCISSSRARTRARSSVAGTVTVKVNFGEDGHVIVAQNTPRIVVDGVPPDVMEEALRIVKTSGSIINNSGRIQTLTIPVVMGQ